LTAPPQTQRHVVAVLTAVLGKLPLAAILIGGTSACCD
jgi:hypothetical protein